MILGLKRILGTCLAVAALSSTPALAEDNCHAAFQGARFTLMVPNKAGGGYDTYARTLAPVFSELSGAKMSVINAPSAGGLVGIAKMAEADPDEHFFGLFGTPKVFGLGDKSVPPSAMQAVAAFAIDRYGWIAKKGAVLDDFIGAEIVGASSTIVTSLVPQVLVGRTFGSKVSLVPGYKGSGHANAAVLRGEVDFSSRSLQSSWLQKKSGDFELLLTITDSALEELGSPPYLAGEGGIVDRTTADWAEAERAKALSDASLAVTLTQHMRGIFTTSKLEGDQLDCIADLFYEAIGSEDFISPMNAAGRPVMPMNRAEAVSC